MKTLKELTKATSRCDSYVSSEYQIADGNFFFFFLRRNKNQMDTLELKSIIIEMEASLEEPAGAKQQEEESWGLKHHTDCAT